jgi:hypothetical protein
LIVLLPRENERSSASASEGRAPERIELTIMLATFVRAARFEIDPGFDPSPSGRMFLLPEAGMPMKITLREDSGRNT